MAGVIGNDIIIAENMANGNFAGAAVLLSGGIDATIGSVHESMMDNSYLYLCLAENTIADKNWRRVTLGAAY